MADEVAIDWRFRGPPASGQGGYSCGLVAEHVDGPCAAVSLRSPPPLERPLQIAQDGGVVRLLDGETLVAEGAASDLVLDVPDPVALDVARVASAHSVWEGRHPFPQCFGCGPDRSQDEAVAIIMGAVRDGELYAGDWTPLAEFADESGAVSKLFTWAALDCPTSVGANVPKDKVSVLARLTCRLVAPIEPEAPHTVVAWPIGEDGRKHIGGTAIHAADGTLCAYAEGLWIELRDPATMGAKTA